MTLAERARGIGALLQRTAELRLSVRMTAAGLLAFILAELLHLAQGYWAVITAIIVVQASIGASLKAGVDRLASTLGGAAYGALVALAIPEAGAAARGLALAVAVTPLALLAAHKASFRVAPVTAVIVLLGGSAQAAGPLASAAARVSEIGIGCLVGLAISMLVLPARAHGLVLKRAQQVVGLLAQMLTALSLGAAECLPSADLAELNQRLRAALRALDMLGQEAARERQARLTDAPDPEPLIRSLRRLRSDLIIIARTAQTPLPEPCRGPLQQPLAAAATAVASALRAAGEALAAGDAPPGAAAAEAALDRCGQAMADLRQAPFVRDLGGDDTARVFALGFALEQLRRDLQDLMSRAGELAGHATLADLP